MGCFALVQWTKLFSHWVCIHHQLEFLHDKPRASCWTQITAGNPCVANTTLFETAPFIAIEGKKTQHTRNNNNKLLSWQPHKGSLYYSRTARQPGHLKLLPILPEQLATTISKTYSVFAPIYMICTLCMQMYACTQPRFFTLFPLYVTLVLQWDFTLKHVKYSFSMLRV